MIAGPGRAVTRAFIGGVVYSHISEKSMSE